MGPLFILLSWAVAGSVLAIIVWLGFMLRQRVLRQTRDCNQAAAKALAVLAAIAAIPALLIGYHVYRSLNSKLIFQDAFGLPYGPEIHELTGYSSLLPSDYQESYLKFHADPEITRGLTLGMTRIEMKNLDMPDWDSRYFPAAWSRPEGDPLEVYFRPGDSEGHAKPAGPSGGRAALIYDPATKTAYFRSIAAD